MGLCHGFQMVVNKPKFSLIFSILPSINTIQLCVSLPTWNCQYFEVDIIQNCLQKALINFINFCCESLGGVYLDASLFLGLFLIVRFDC